MDLHPEDLELSLRLAAVADATSTGLYGSSLDVTAKADGTSVSDADLMVEEALLRILRDERPGDTVISEERGSIAGDPSRQWIIDPIDGTDPFLSGQRCWGTHIALNLNGLLEVAVITRPTEQRRWWAVRGHGARSSPTDTPPDEGSRLQVSTVDDLAAARIDGFVDPASHTAASIAEHAHWTVDPLGPIIGLVEGRIDAVIAPGGELWDHAPQILLTTEAGGRYVDRNGDTDPAARGGTYSNGLLHHQLLAVFG